MTELLVNAIETTIVDVPTRRAHQFANLEMTSQAYLLVRISTDAGVSGVGEGVAPGGPWWGGESIEGQQQMIDGYLAPALIGTNCLDFAEVQATMDRIAYGNDFAKAAVETAVTDAAARLYEVPAHVLLGGTAARSRLPVRWALSALGTSEPAQEAVDRLAAGYHAIKFKMGALPPDEDIRRIGLLVDKIGADVDFLADPNGSWDFRTAAWATNELEAIGVRVLEQPLERSDLPGLAELRRRNTSLRIMADESVCRPGDALAVARARCVDAVSVKPGKAGGLHRAWQVATISGTAGLACYGGTALETSVGTAATAHLCAALPELPLGCELIGPELLADDLTTEPVQYRDGELQVPSGPGLGVEIDWDKVDRYSRRPS